MRPELEAQRRREAFAHRIARLAVDDDRNHPIGAAHRSEAENLLVDVSAFRRVRRAEHDQELGCPQRRQRVLGERIAHQITVAAAEDRSQRPWHRTRGRRPPEEVLVDAIAFEGGSQPPSPTRIAVTVTQEYAVLERSVLCHALPPRSRDEQPDGLQRSKASGCSAVLCCGNECFCSFATAKCHRRCRLNVKQFTDGKKSATASRRSIFRRLLSNAIRRPVGRAYVPEKREPVSRIGRAQASKARAHTEFTRAGCVLKG
jgi:hypothetical protein